MSTTRRVAASETGRRTRTATVAVDTRMEPAKAIRRPSIKRHPWRVTDGNGTPEVTIRHR